MTAQAIRKELATANRNYLALRSQQDQDRRVFRFSKELDDAIVWRRNNIIELQTKLRKVVNANA